MKKLLTILLTLAMVFSMAGVVSADDTTQEDQTTDVIPEEPQLPQGTSSGMELNYEVDSGYILSIPSDVSFNENLESTGVVKLSNVRLPSKGMLTVTVNSPNEFKLQTGTDLVISKIQYFVTRDDGTAVTNTDSVVLEVSEGVSENAEELTFSTTQEDIDGAILSGKHTDMLSFTVASSINQNAVESKEITIGNLDQLEAFRDSVNNGNTYKGVTVRLTADIDLGNEEWTPIGTSTTKFEGLFDGDGHTIKNLKITSDTGNGFFGYVGEGGKIQNLIFDGAVVSTKIRGVGVAAGSIFKADIDGVTVKNAKISGYGQVGGVVGGSYGSVTNCKVIDSEITAVPELVDDKYDNGNQVGGIIGLLASDYSGVVTGNTVSGLTLKAYRDVGGIAGAAKGSNVYNNDVNDVFIIVNQKDVNYYEEKPVNAAEIFGPRFDDKTVDQSNTHEDVYIWIDGVLQGGPIEEVGTPGALKAFAMDVGLGNDYEGKTITLTEDIDLSGVTTNGDSFAPIGTTGERDERNRLITNPFKGTFDGGGNTISNLYQSGWDFGYEWGQYGSIGLFSELEGATVKNVVLEGFECQVEGGDVAFITGSATGYCTFENIEIKSGSIGTYNNGIGGIIGWSGAGTYTFKDITIGSDVVLGGLWGSFDSSIGGVVGQAEPGATYNFENVDIACRLDAYNDVTAAYKYYLYRMTGMLIGRMEETITIDGKNYPDTSKYYINCEDVTVTYNDWANYHYCVVEGKTAWRHEPGFTYGGIPADHDHDTCNSNMHNLELPFDGLFGGAQYGVNPITEYDGVTVVYNNK